MEERKVTEKYKLGRGRENRVDPPLQSVSLCDNLEVPDKAVGWEENSVWSW